MKEQTLFQSINMEQKEGVFTLWIYKDKEGDIHYRGQERNSDKSFSGKVRSLPELIDSALKEANAERGVWLIRMDIHENEGEFKKEEVEYVRSLKRWGCIADDYNDDRTLYEEFEVKDGSKN